VSMRQRRLVMTSFHSPVRREGVEKLRQWSVKYL
jgi:hypothetical protein